MRKRLGFFLHFLTIAAHGAGLEQLAHFALRGLLNGLDAVFLLGRQTERLRHFRIRQRLPAALLQRDLFESLELVFLQDFGQHGLIGLRVFLHLRLAFFPAEIAQAGERFALLLDLLGGFLDLFVRHLEFFLDGLLRQQAQAVASWSAPAAKPRSATAAPLSQGR